MQKLLGHGYVLEGGNSLTENFTPLYFDTTKEACEDYKKRLKSSGAHYDCYRISSCKYRIDCGECYDD